MNSAISVLIFVAAVTWLLVLVTACTVGLVVLWRRRSLRMWVEDFDRGLEREERLHGRTGSSN